MGDTANPRLILTPAMRRLAALAACLLLVPAWSAAPETYTAVRLTPEDSENNQLEVTLSDGRSRAMARDTKNQQVGFEQPLISADGSRVGWLALYPNCCTSYALPLALVIYRHGRVETRIHGTAQAIFKWQFSESGDSVFYCERAPHGPESDRLVRQKIGRAKPDEVLYSGPDDPVTAFPAWAAAVRC